MTKIRYLIVPHHLLKTLSFLHLIAFAPLLKIYWLCMYKCISKFLCSIDLFLSFANFTLIKKTSIQLKSGQTIWTYI